MVVRDRTKTERYSLRDGYQLVTGISDIRLFFAQPAFSQPPHPSIHLLDPVYERTKDRTRGV